MKLLEDMKYTTLLTDETPIPHMSKKTIQWADFLGNRCNKRQLIKFLGTKFCALKVPFGKTLYVGGFREDMRLVTVTVDGLG